MSAWNAELEAILFDARWLAKFVERTGPEEKAVTRIQGRADNVFRFSKGNVSPALWDKTMSTIDGIRTA